MASERQDGKAGEAKWTRGLLANAMQEAKKKLPELHCACGEGGRWAAVNSVGSKGKAEKIVKAKVIGVVAVSE